MEEANTQSFDDLLHRLDEALAGPAGAALAERIRGRFHAVLIDEFQDTDPVQYRIFERLYRGGEGGLFLIGDPKQAIYAFRGADVFTYMQAKRDAAKPVYTLDTNRRSGPRLLAAINSVFALGEDRAPFVFDEIPFTPMRPAPDAADALGGAAAGRPPLQILFVPRPSGERPINKGWADDNLPRLVAAEIARFLACGATIEGREVDPGDIAVLCRKNKQAARVQEELRGLAIPSVLQGDASVFESPECRELERVLRAMAEPTDAAALRAALVTPLCGLGGADLFALKDDEAGWDGWVRRFQDWSERWRADGFMPAFRRMLDGCDAPPRLLALTDGERRLTNVLHLGELLQTAAAETRRGPLGLVEWLAEMRVDAAARGEMAGEAAQMRLESDADALKLTTVHKSKGLEYPIVYCPFLWDGKLLYGEDDTCLRFHAPDGTLTMDLGSPQRDEHRRLAEREALAESLRLLYVALTRAKHRCSVVWGAFREAETSALGYLLHQPPSLPAGESAETAAKEHVGSLDDEAMRAELQALVERSGGSVEVELLADEPGPIWTGGRAPTAGELSCRVAKSRGAADVENVELLAARGVRRDQPPGRGGTRSRRDRGGDRGGRAAPRRSAPWSCTSCPRERGRGRWCTSFSSTSIFPPPQGEVLAYRRRRGAAPLRDGSRLGRAAAARRDGYPRHAPRRRRAAAAPAAGREAAAAERAAVHLSGQRRGEAPVDQPRAGGCLCAARATAAAAAVRAAPARPRLRPAGRLPDRLHRSGLRARRALVSGRLQVEPARRAAARLRRRSVGRRDERATTTSSSTTSTSWRCIAISPCGSPATTTSATSAACTTSSCAAWPPPIPSAAACFATSRRAP